MGIWSCHNRLTTKIKGSLGRHVISIQSCWNKAETENWSQFFFFFLWPVDLPSLWCLSRPCLHVVWLKAAHPGAYPTHRRQSRWTDYRPNPPVNVNFLNLLILGTGEVGDDVTEDDGDDEADEDGLCESSRLTDSSGLFPLSLALVLVVYSWLFRDEEDWVEERDLWFWTVASWSARTSSSLTSEEDIWCCWAVVLSKISMNLEEAILFHVINQYFHHISEGM